VVDGAGTRLKWWRVALHATDPGLNSQYGDGWVFVKLSCRGGGASVWPQQHIRSRGRTVALLSEH
jgi:hypothetical protein